MMDEMACNRLVEKPKLSGPGDAGNIHTGPDHRPTAGGSAHMADAANIAESRALSSGDDTWLSIGAIARQLVEAASR